MKNLKEYLIKESEEEVLVVTHDEDDDLICVSAFWYWLREAGFKPSGRRHNWSKLDKKYGNKCSIVDDKVDECIEFINKGTSGFKTKSMTIKVKSENGSCEVSSDGGDIAHIKYTKDKA